MQTGPPDLPCRPLCPEVSQGLHLSLSFPRQPPQVSPACLCLSHLHPAHASQSLSLSPCLLPSARAPLAAARAPSQGRTMKSFPWAVQGVTASLQRAELTAWGWPGPHSLVCCRGWGSHGRAHEQGIPTHTSVGEPQTGHAGARAGAAPMKQEAPQEAADGPGRGSHAGGPREPHRP